MLTRGAPISVVSMLIQLLSTTHSPIGCNEAVPLPYFLFFTALSLHYNFFHRHNFLAQKYSDLLLGSAEPLNKSTQRRGGGGTWHGAPLLLTAGSYCTCTQEDDLIIQGQLREVRDPLSPLHQGKQLLICSLADVGDGIMGLGGKNNKNH